MVLNVFQKYKPLDMFVIKFRDIAIIMGLGLIMEDDIFIVYYIC